MLRSVLEPDLLVNLVHLQLQSIGHGDKQCLAKAQSRTQGSERKRATFIDQQQGVGALGQLLRRLEGRLVEVIDDVAGDFLL